MTADSTLKTLSNGLADAVEIAGPATVLVAGRKGYPSSGIIYKPDRVLTASHAVESDTDVTVMMPNGDEAAAEVAGRDSKSDIALLRLEKTADAAGAFSKELPKVGHIVLALARPTNEGIQASVGIIGIAGGRYEIGHGKYIENVMRTDATFFPGFAGGPLVNVNGEVIGINTFGAKYGASLTVPIERAKATAEQLEKTGTLKRGYLGIRSQVVELPETVAAENASRTALLIAGIEAGSPADRYGLLMGDVLIRIEGVIMDSHGVLLDQLHGLAGREVKLTVLRAGNIEEIMLTIGEAPH